MKRGGSWGRRKREPCNCRGNVEVCGKLGQCVEISGGSLSFLFVSAWSQPCVGLMLVIVNLNQRSSIIMDLMPCWEVSSRVTERHTSQLNSDPLSATKQLARVSDRPNRRIVTFQNDFNPRRSLFPCFIGQGYRCSGCRQDVCYQAAYQELSCAKDQELVLLLGFCQLWLIIYAGQVVASKFRGGTISVGRVQPRRKGRLECVTHS